MVLYVSARYKAKMACHELVMCKKQMRTPFAMRK